MVCGDIPSEQAHVAFVDRDDQMIFEHVRPRSADTISRSRTTDIIRQSLKERRPLILNADLTSGWENRRDAETRPGKSLLCFPFFYKNGCGGAVCLCRESRRDPFAPGDLEKLMFLCRSVEHIAEDHLRRETPEPERADPTALDLFIGQSRAAQSIRALVDKVKDSLAPVFIYGESGTGKELIARAIHNRGPRRTGPFVAVNCGAIPDLLLESELFGHARGAFTGALRDKAGLIEEANGGTFFLDEIGDLSQPLQAKLLRLLQEKEVRRVGETRTRRVDTRFISATNKNIEQEIEKENCREIGRKRAYVSPPALELLMAYSWPGNVRELQNEIQRALILAAGEDLLIEDHLSAKINPRGELSSPVSYNFFAARAEFEKRFLSQALQRFGNNKARTAHEIGLTRQGLFKLIKKHSLNVRAGEGSS
jgi:transcriptional regulator with PAS, ATPase and Fis domain